MCRLPKQTRPRRRGIHVVTNLNEENKRPPDENVIHACVHEVPQGVKIPRIELIMDRTAKDDSNKVAREKNPDYVVGQFRAIYTVTRKNNCVWCNHAVS
mmetsp:Transcript_18164/g.29490  ORF Transcript_18164/g.29490 Transcript_18164/m.29490 type:complete len:99 (-) Transcript_18164:1106-1402(-)